MLTPKPPQRVLMIAYHFPPMRGSSGIQRTLKFAAYLPAQGWQPVVLSAHPRAYVNPGADQMADIPAGIHVCRAFAIDTARHLAFRGRYAALLAQPDRWISWLLGALPAGWRLVRRYRPQVLWSTYPIATAHLIGYMLQRLTGLPWVADMRDPMTDQGYPEAALTRRAYLWIERKTVASCTLAVCTTAGAIATYRRRFPEVPASRFRLIENGYDEESFIQAGAIVPPPGRPGVTRPLRLLHSGVIYPSERDPVPLCTALAMLLAQGAISAATLHIVLRASGHDALLAGLVAAHGLRDIIELAPPLPYREALAEMLGADGLLVLQASNCNHQVPAKLYEYLRAGRPILALTDATGDTAATLHAAGVGMVAPLDAAAAIAAVLPRFMAQVADGVAPLASAAVVAQHSRQARSAALAALLDEVARAAPATKARAVAA
jgi:glycosyltransferase involved in cell wall biosynthesis